MMNPARQWALATGGLLARLNKKDPTLLGGSTPGPESAKASAEVLKEFWEIGSRAKLLETLRWLTREGHRKEFAEMCALDAATTATLEPWEHLDAKISDEEVLANIHFTRAHRERVGPRSLLAWDGCRVVSVAGWGFLAGMISEDEAFSFIMPIAALLQRSYSSWDELGKHYLLGREYNSGSWDAPLARCHLALLEDPQSPWRILPWSVDLDGHGVPIPLEGVVFEPLPPATHVAKKKFDPTADVDQAFAGAGGNAAAPNRTIQFVVGGTVLLVLVAVGAAFALGLIGPLASSSSEPSSAATAPAVPKPAAPPKAAVAPKKH